MMTAEFFFIALAVAVTAFRFVMLFKRAGQTNNAATTA